jgi:hypothetical protein
MTEYLCYIALVNLSFQIMEYSSVKWDPFTTDSIQKLNLVPHRSAQFGMRDNQTLAMLLLKRAMIDTLK